jgi:hypothetical protein
MPRTIVEFAHKCDPWPYNSFKGKETKHTLRVYVEEGAVLVWDGVAEHYTRCHALIEGQSSLIVKKAAKMARDVSFDAIFIYYGDD